MPKFAVDRSIVIQRSSEEVFDKVADFAHWREWSPWLCAEPNATVTVSDNSNSIGSKYAWEGKIVGAGELEHESLSPGSRIEDKIRFFKPFKSESNVVFDFEPDDNGTKVTWKMQGALPWFMFWMKPMMQSLISMDYERGLKMLKEWIETGQIKSKTENKGVQNIGPLCMAGVRRISKLSEVSKWMGGDLKIAKQKLDEQSIQINGCMAVYHKFNLRTQQMEYTSGYITSDVVDVPGLNTWNIGNARALRCDHIGSYGHLGNGWFAANQIARNTKLKQSSAGAFEIYRNDPESVAEEDLVTEIYLPLK